jgi:hypothetical protein
VRSCGVRKRLEGEACGIPHLAKNERDVGHPAVFAGDEAQRALVREINAKSERKERKGSDPSIQEG